VVLVAINAADLCKFRKVLPQVSHPEEQEAALQGARPPGLPGGGGQDAGQVQGDGGGDQGAEERRSGGNGGGVGVWEADDHVARGRGHKVLKLSNSKIFQTGFVQRKARK